MIDLMKYLSENPYPGRGIVLGRTASVTASHLGAPILRTGVPFLN